ncbi:MAG TPA: YetF domain-containing protein [Candidatus Limnocylindrales bacterium]|nr:YetF domain-containing protein [Candidatus Limnocylindrales bacterium]
MTIPDLGDDLPGVILRTAIVYVSLVIGFRLLGKREAGQLSTLDLVVLLVIANAVQNAMVGQNTSLIAGLIAAGVILVLDLLLHRAADRWEALRNALDGEPTLLVDHGRILYENLRNEGISERELQVALRQNQLLSAEEALYVFLETNGQISVIPKRDENDDRPPNLNGEGRDAQAGGSTWSGGGIGRRRHRRPGRLSGGSS